jgi:hypothetical protein
MHHKRRSRRKDKLRYWPCGCCVDRTFNGKEPIEDGPCTGKLKKKRKHPPKPGCPSNPNGSHHQYLKDTEIVIEDYGWPISRHHKYERKYKLCVWCGKEVRLKSRYLGPA